MHISTHAFRHKKIVSVIITLLLLSFSCPTYADTPQTVQPSDIISQSAVLMDAETGQILFEKNMHEKLPPASITKIMTALLAIEKGKLSDKITMSHDAVFSVPRGASHIALDEGEILTLEEALYAMLLVSANDAANGIAEYISGSMDKFAALMNARALELNAIDTQFKNPSGLTEEGHYTSAYDMALITRQAMQYPVFNKIWGTRRYEMTPTNLQEEVRYLNTQNRMLVPSNTNYYDKVIGGKLGWTTEAQNTMVVAAQQDGRTLLCVLLRSQNSQAKYQDARLLFEYGFNHFNKISLEDLSIPADFTFLLHESIQPDQIVINYGPVIEREDGTMHQTIKLSLPEGTEKLMYQEIGQTSIETKTYHNVSNNSRWQIILNILLAFIKILAAAVLILFILACYFRTRRRVRRQRRRLQQQNTSMLR